MSKSLLLQWSLVLEVKAIALPFPSIESIVESFVKVVVISVFKPLLDICKSVIVDGKIGCCCPGTSVDDWVTGCDS